MLRRGVLGCGSRGGWLGGESWMRGFEWWRCHVGLGA